MTVVGTGIAEVTLDSVGKLHTLGPTTDSNAGFDRSELEHSFEPCHLENIAY